MKSKGNEKAGRFVKLGLITNDCITQPEREVGISYQEGCNVISEIIERQEDRKGKNWPRRSGT